MGEDDVVQLRPMSKHILLGDEAMVAALLHLLIPKEGAALVGTFRLIVMIGHSLMLGLTGLKINRIRTNSSKVKWLNIPHIS